jgi:glycosyltransferase involved in cell wall biosynthesis
LLLKAKPDITIQISGGDPKEFHALANKYPKHIFLQGWVDDIRAAYAESRVFVAPLFTGAGVQNKILEAMSMMIPCVTTPVVNASLNAIRKSSTCIWLKDASNSFREKILYLHLAIQIKSSLLTDQAKVFVHENFSWEKNSKKLEQLF